MAWLLADTVLLVLLSSTCTLCYRLTYPSVAGKGEKAAVLCLCSTRHRGTVLLDKGPRVLQKQQQLPKFICH